ncbi:TonB-dependent receptor [Pseudoxanthomonas broegbernensis]|uniref:TonB-dependent receptor n=1 Tax=Pseudoxanthomonas broegbernensis TaxID=83619 RepID=A0A7V8GQ85_9GAMM|nr:TonB-dependent receptor [Pseudoxanthomonas broegbernensis]KAF1688182.1 TonB-dependent receptor [Pseudoxanthomonas broegbernensis]MBB6065236.1 TonB-dependent receptor [Pseudoxanthomonas broegbernensis]
MSNHKRNLLSAALASAIALAATGAGAQTAEPNNESNAETVDLDTVVVTGIRRGIESAISVKRESSSIVESISAEDIGKLPDVSIGESIARLPGVAAQRVAGRAQVISVRGLSPDFSTTLLNGREMVSTGDNRSVEFDQYPSELVSGVTVYKTPDAALVGQGLSGTLDMQTARPLNFADRVVAVSGRYQRNSLGSAANQDGDGSRFNVSYIDQSADRRFGFSIGYSHSDSPIQENQVGLYEPWQSLGGDDWRPGVSAGTWYSDGIKALRRTGNIKRDGAMATLQFRPSNAWTSTLDLFYSKAEQVDTANQFEVHLGGYNGGYDPGLALTGVTSNANGSFDGGVAHNVYPLVRGMYNHREDRIKAAGWNNEFNAGSVRIVADVGWSKADRDELSLENNTQMAPMPQLDSVALDIRGNGFSTLAPGRDYSDPSSLFLTNTIYGSGYGKVPSISDELKTYRLSAEFPAPQALSWLSGIDAGVNRADRHKNKSQPEGNILLGAQGDATIGQEYQYRPVDLGFAGIGYIPAWNVPGAVAQYMTFDPVDDLSYLVPKAWTLDEKITTGYIRASIDTQWGALPVTGNIGVQVQRVDQSSASRYWDNTKPAGQEALPFSDGKTYTDVLPSLNLALRLTDDQTLRFGLAKQVARPRVDQLRSSLEFGVNEAEWEVGGSGGNPNLDPWRANAFDVSWEKYFGTRAYVAAAFFYKDLESYIYTETRDGYDFSALMSGYVPPAGAPPISPIGRFTQPVNNKGGSLRGLELSASLPLDLWTEALRGFGIVASATFNDSDIKIRDPESASSVGEDPISLPGLSDRVFNLTAYYERNGFEARVSQRRRSDFIGEIGNFDGNRTLRYVVGENITDAQVSYSFGGGGALSGLTVLLQASNLTDESYRTYAGTKDRPLEHIEWGRTYLLGLNYRF